MALSQWAVPQLSELLPLDEESLKQIITYTDTLSRDAAADHLTNILGDTPQAIEFITSFNQRRPPPPAEPVASSTNNDSQHHDGVPKAAPKSHKKKTPFNKLPAPRQVDRFDDSHGAYKKHDLDDYMPASSRPKKEPPLSNTLALQSRPDAQQLPAVGQGMAAEERPRKLPPSAAGQLVSDSLPSSRSASPAGKQKTKVNLTGGTSMRGASTTLNDLDSAIRSLEMQTNPALAGDEDVAKRRCNCMAQRHALLTAAPNCLKCGKIICAKEGLGPCTFCANPLLSSSEIQAMVRVLKEERGKERQEANNAAHKRPDVSKTPRPFSSGLSTPAASSAPSSDSESETLARAKQHRDKLLKFQAENARRTTIRDEAADFETPDAGLNQWASPQERALQLKKQQKVLREQEWNARPEYEKRQMVVSIDVKGGKAVKRFADVERPAEPEPEVGDDGDYWEAPMAQNDGGGGAFSRNPLLGSMIRPVYKVEDDGKEVQSEKRSTWRRVQDDNDDNEAWILDGGAYGDRVDGRVLGAEEHAFG